VNAAQAQVRLKRWLTTVELSTLRIPQLAPVLPPGVINDAWPVLARDYPLTIRGPLNGARAFCWATWHLRVVFPGRALKNLFHLAWTAGASLQAFAAVLVAVGLFIVLSVPLRSVTAVVRATAWVVLVRRGWQPPISRELDTYLAELDAELDHNIAREDAEIRALTTSGQGGMDRYPPPGLTPITLQLQTPPTVTPSIVRSRARMAGYAVLAVLVVGVTAWWLSPDTFPHPPDWDTIHATAEGQP